MECAWWRRSPCGSCQAGGLSKRRRPCPPRIRSRHWASARWKSRCTACCCGTPNKVELEALARGVEYRGIYDKAALEAAPGTIDAIARYVTAGEQARFLSTLPLKLATFDREFGYVPLTVSQPDIAQFMVVRPCSLLDALLYIFDTLWENAAPITFGPDGSGDHDHSGEIASGDSRLLNLLATGMTDQAIARHLGLSYRTARRRIAALMAALGANSRFQAGIQANRNGWL